MPLFKRREGELVKDEHPMRYMLPFLMPTRNESVTYSEHKIYVENVQKYLAEKNVNGGVAQVTLFHVFLAATVRILALRPRLNRFVVGQRLYQRNQIALSFAVKKRKHDDAGMTAVKVVFEPSDTLSEIIKKVNSAIFTGRGKKKTTSEKEMSLIVKLPRFLIRFLVGAQRWLDSHNLLPYSMLRDDPMYASVFLANLGSIGIVAPFHHLYEYGTVPIFLALGPVEKVPDVDTNGQLCVRDVMMFRGTYDERIGDGFYAARSLDMFNAILQNPGQLEYPPDLESSDGSALKTAK